MLESRFVGISYFGSTSFNCSTTKRLSILQEIWTLMCALPDLTSNYCTKIMSNGCVFPSIIQAVDASTVRDICMEYIYDKCPAVAAVGKSKFSPRNKKNI